MATNYKKNNRKDARKRRTAKRERPVYDLDIKVRRAFDGEYGILFDLEINHVTIYGCRLVEIDSTGECFVGFPQKRGRDGKYWSHAYVPLSDEQQKGIIKDVYALLDGAEDGDEEAYA